MSLPAPGLQLIKPGPRSLIQDRGRMGYQHQGLATGGPADYQAFRWANRLLDNDPGCACLEITLGGFEATALCRMSLAVTGAAATILINNSAHPGNATLEVRAGDTIRLEAPRAGLLSYLAVAGGWQTTTFLGSRSVVMREHLAGLAPARAGDCLPCKPQPPHRDARVPAPALIDYQEPVELRILPTAQTMLFSQQDRRTLTAREYRISPHSDRMGYRLSGPPLASGPGGIVSEAIPLGSIQIPGDGQPLILLSDRQTIGGYPKIGAISLLDCSRLAQRRPGSTASFRWSDLAQCRQERNEFEQLLTRELTSGTHKAQHY
ncbi:biotin-dependent carboxyltransferase family protein [uncultured Marinobacter sp.]|uniref:5-oxoprolinase subunit C family protein n=1 Tax=uncultured Marinobacter sp. TaxID=187379 RepID=UPI0030DCBC97